MDNDQCLQTRSLPQLTIVGLGPGGLSAAIEAAKLGFRVEAFTKPRYSRGQRFKVYASTMGFLESLEDPNDPQDMLFFEKMIDDDSIQIKDLEKFLYRKLALYSDLVHIITLDDSNPITEILYDTSQQANYLRLLDGTKYYFTHLIGAEGIKRTVARLVKEGLNVPIDYQDCTQDPHPYHASVQLFANKNKSCSSPLKSETELGWPTDGRAPTALILTNHPDKEPNKFSYTGEIPQLIFTAPEHVQTELLKNWAILQITKEYPNFSLLQHLDFRTSRKDTQGKNKLKALTFRMNLSVCRQAAFQIHNGYYAPIGDARRTPDYKIGHGLHDAIAMGIEFARCICKDNTFAVTRYESFIARIDTALAHGYAYFSPHYTEDPRSNLNDIASIDTTDSETSSLDASLTIFHPVV